MVYLLTENDLGRAVEVHVPEANNPEEYTTLTGFVSGFDDKYIYVKYPDKDVAQAELAEWVFWADGPKQD